MLGQHGTEPGLSDLRVILRPINEVWYVLLRLVVVESLLESVCIKIFLELIISLLGGHMLPFLLKTWVRNWSALEGLKLLLLELRCLKRLQLFSLLHAELNSLLDSLDPLAAIFLLITFQFLDICQAC